MKSFSKIAIVANTSKVGSIDFAKKLCISLSERCDLCEILNYTSLSSDELADFDVCLTIGGDGTVLGIVPQLLSANVVVMPINNGFLGFLSAASVNDSIDSIVNCLFGDFKALNRNVLHVRAEDGQEFFALNDVVLKNFEKNRVARLEVFCDGDFVNKYSADGLIVSTPTGSTAYNLAAGGPVVAPNVDCVLLTPILSHGFNNRSVIFDGNSTIVIKDCSRSGKINLSCDTIDATICNGEIFIKKHKRALTFICSGDYSFYEVLRKKLKW